MEISKKRIIYNITLIIAAVMVGVSTYQSTISKYAFLIAGIGTFLTIGNIIPFKGKISYWILGLLFLAMFIIVFTITF